MVESGNKWDATKPRIEISMGCACSISTHISTRTNSYKLKGLELVERAHGTHIFHLDIAVGNFGLHLKMFRSFRKFSGRANQNSLFINIPTEIFGFFSLVNGKHSIERSFCCDILTRKKKIEREGGCSFKGSTYKARTVP